MTNELISIIIPIYNVENFLNRCIKSTINQTYDNLEIILVDDGSSDSSLSICKKYKYDKRIKIFHKKNGGLSDARNYGMKKATGVYYYFLDADDYINTRTIEILYNNLRKYKADISCGKEKVVYNKEDINDFTYNKNVNHILLFSNESALENILYMKDISNSACNKLYKKTLFDGIEFPFGKLYEDLGTIYKVVGKSNKVVFTTDELYYYYLRKNSITHQTFNINRMVTLDFSNDILMYVKSNFPNIISSAKFKIDMEAIMILLSLPKNKKYCIENYKVKNIINKYNIFVILDKKVKLNWKMSCISVYFGRYFLRLTWKIKLFLKKIIK